MATFFEADQVRLQLKMKLSNYSWYKSATVITDSDGYGVLIGSKIINNEVRKTIPPVIDGVSIRTELDN